MSIEHGMNSVFDKTKLHEEKVGIAGIPVYIGVSPLFMAENPAMLFEPVLCHSFSEVRKHFGYSIDFAEFPLCSAMYTHFEYGEGPAFFVNTQRFENDVPIDKTVEISNRKGILNECIQSVHSVKSGETQLSNKDYTYYYNDEGTGLIFEILSEQYANVSDLTVNVSLFRKVVDSESEYANCMEGLEKCVPKYGIAPQMIIPVSIPNFKGDVASITAAKFSGKINGVFPAHAFCQLNYVGKEASSLVNIAPYSDITYTYFGTSFGEKMYVPTNVLVAAKLSAMEYEHGIPYESVSNKPLDIDKITDESGNEVLLTLSQANEFEAKGVVVPFRFVNGFTAWGNYTSLKPVSEDVAEIFVNQSRVRVWISNRLIIDHWSKIDDSTNRNLIDSAVDSANIWLNGLVGSEYLNGARVEFRDEENPESDLINGVMRFHVYYAGPVPARRIDWVIECDINYLKAAIA